MDPRIKALPRHERLPDLLAASEDLHVRKTCRIKFIGDYNPMDDDRVLAKLLLSESGRSDLAKPFTPLQCKAIRHAAAKARKPVAGHFERLMEPDHRYAMAVMPHLKRAYRWHAGNGFIEHVDFGDVDAILSSSSGKQFINLDDREPDEPVILQPSPEVFKLIALEAVPSMAMRGVGPQRGEIVAAH